VSSATGLVTLAGAAGFLNAQRLRTLIRVMRYSGLRISDAVSLSTDRITDDKLFLYTQKTGTPVYTVLLSFLVKELAATPRVTDKLYFWSGNGELESSTKDWHTSPALELNTFTIPSAI